MFGGAVYRCVLLVLVLVLVWCDGVPYASAAANAPAGANPNPAPSPPHGFRDDPLNHAFLQTLQHSPPYIPPTTTSSTPWQSHVSLASYLSIAPMSPVDVPIRIYLYIVGLDGTGSLGVNLSRPQLSSWLSHLCHSLEHALVNFTDTHDINIHTQHAVTARYRYSYHVVELSPLVTDVLERVVSQYHRKIQHQQDTPQGNNMVQVDADRMNGVLESLVQHLQLQPYGYHVFVLNPKLSAYGYRSGFSNTEIEAILGATSRTSQDAELASAVRSYVEREAAAAMASSATTTAPTPPSSAASWSSTPTIPIPEAARQHYTTLTKHEPVTFQDRVLDSHAWAKTYLDQPFRQGPESLVSYFQHLMAESGSASDKAAQILKCTVGNQYAQQDGLVDAWIGDGAIMWLDLAAGPFEWGPSIGGQGVRTKHTFPSVTQTFQLAAQHWVTTDTDEQISAESDEAQSGDTVEAVQAEMLLVEQKWTAAKCDEQQQQMEPLCTALINQMSQLQQYADDLSNNAKKQSPKEERVGKLLDPSSFSFIHGGVSGEEQAQQQADGAAAKVNTPDTTATPEAGKGADKGVAAGAAAGAGAGAGAPSHLEQLEMDHFMAHLGSSLQTLLSHVITPAVAQSDSADAGYYSRVAFHLYVLSNHETYDPLADDMVGRFRRAMEQLRLPSQEFSVQVHSLNMDDDPTLAMAYTSSVRSTVVPAINSVGHYASFKRLYLDSRRLKAELTRLGVDRQASQLEHSRGARDIPIFLFSLNHPLPVFVDQQYQSMSLDNMVIAVQSALHLWESPVKCNGRPIYWNLRDPVRSMVLSAAQVLSGLLPIHLSHSRPNNSTAQDWSWSVGTSPASATSTAGVTFSQIQRDVVYRNYIIQAIRHSSSRVNTAVRSLQEYQTSSLPWGVTQNQHFVSSLANIQQQYQTYQQAFNQLVTVFDTRDWAMWCRAVPPLLEQANKFAGVVNDTLHAITGWRCTRSDTDSDTLSSGGAQIGSGGGSAAVSEQSAPAPVPAPASQSPWLGSRVVSFLRFVYVHSLNSVYVCMMVMLMLMLWLRRLVRTPPRKPKFN